MVSFFFLRVKTDVYFCLYSTPANNQEKCRGRRTWTTDSPLFDNFEPLWYIIAKISARILLALQSNKIPIRVARGTSPMTARQPPREKGAKACTIGLYQSRDWYFCAYFSGSTEKWGAFLLLDESYVVRTHLGCFRLDRGAYEDYLAGKLWITWIPG